MRYILAIILAFSASPASAMRYTQSTIFSNASVTASNTSNGIDTQQLSLASIHFIVGSGVTGSFTLQGSNQNVQVYPGPDQAGYVTQWADYVGVTASNGVANSYIYNLPDIGWRWLRVKYTHGSGSGSITELFTGKGP